MKTLALLFAALVLPLLSAYSQNPNGFTSSSTVIQEDATTYYIGAEAYLYPTISENGDVLALADLSFTLPPNGTIKALQGTLTFKAPINAGDATCQAASLAMLMVDGKVLPIITKLNNGGRESNRLISYTVPLRYTAGSARLHVQADGCPSTWEFQGVLEIVLPRKATTAVK